MGIEILGGASEKAEARFELSYEEAKKRGLISPGGIFALLGELDYYRLIEKLIRSSITENQLITPYKWYLYFKGSALANIIGFMLFAVRFGLLVPGENVDYTVKLAVFFVCKVLLIYGTANFLLDYISYPRGAVYTAVKYSLIGYLVGIFLVETIFSLINFLTLIFRDSILEMFYSKYRILDVILETWYNYFVGSILDEILCYLLTISAIIAAIIRFKTIKKQKEYEEHHREPFEVVQAY